MHYTTSTFDTFHKVPGDTRTVEQLWKLRARQEWCDAGPLIYCWRLNCIPIKTDVRIPTSNTYKRGHIWKQDPCRWNWVRMRSYLIRVGLTQWLVSLQAEGNWDTEERHRENVKVEAEKLLGTKKCQGLQTAPEAGTEAENGFSLSAFRRNQPYGSLGSGLLGSGTVREETSV